MSVVRIAELLENLKSADGLAVRVATYEQDYIFSGKCFSIESFVSISSGNTDFDIVFDTTGMSRQLVAMPTNWFTTAGDVTINLGSCSSYSGGTEIVPTNRNYEFATAYPSQVTFKHDITATGHVAGSTNLLIGSAATNQNSGGGGLEGRLPIVLETGLKYVFRVANNSGQDIKFSFLIFWYEL